MTYDIGGAIPTEGNTFRGARGEKGKVTQKARVTLVWNGEKVIDDAEIDGPTGSALDGNATEPGPRGPRPRRWRDTPEYPGLPR